eukprot:NODE_13_length_54415_cov_0.522424.p4 type:complete len:689 gc:universal NODE_13_length_54415_cov_0.522424:47112-45046(-)
MSKVFQSILNSTITPRTIGKISVNLLDQNYEVGMRFFDACVPLENYQRTPQKFKLLERARAMTTKDIDQILNLPNTFNKRNNLAYMAIINNELPPEKLNVEIAEYELFLSQLSKNKMYSDLLGFFNYLPGPSTFAYSKILNYLFKSNPTECLEMYKKATIELNFERDTHLDNIGLKSYLALGSLDKALNLFDTTIKDDVTYAIMMKFFINKRDPDRAYEFYQEFEKKCNFISIGSVTAISNLLLAKNQYDKLKELITKFQAAKPAKFGLLLSIAVYESIKLNLTKSTASLLGDFQGLTFKEVRSVLLYHNEVAMKQIMKGGLTWYKNSRINLSVELSKIKSSLNVPLVYTENKTQQQWEALKDLIMTVDVEHLGQSDVSSILNIISKKVLISRSIDAQILYCHIKRIPLKSEHEELLKNDPFLLKMFTIPYNSKLEPKLFCRLMSQIIANHPNLSVVERFCNEYDCDIRLYIWIIDKWFYVYHFKNKNEIDYKVIDRAIDLLQKSDRSLLWGKHFFRLFRIFIDKPKFYAKDKQRLLNLLMNLSNLPVLVLEKSMKKFSFKDPKFAKNLFQNFSLLVEGSIPEIYEISVLYWRLLDFDELKSYIANTLEIIGQYKVPEDIAKASRAKVSTINDCKEVEKLFNCLDKTCSNLANREDLPIEFQVFLLYFWNLNDILQQKRPKNEITQSI